MIKAHDQRASAFWRPLDSINARIPNSVALSDVICAMYSSPGL